MSDKTPASRQLLNITKAALDSAEHECETIRGATIEQCARVAENYGGHNVPLIAAAIRALKDKPL